MSEVDGANYELRHCTTSRQCVAGRGGVCLCVCAIVGSIVVVTGNKSFSKSSVLQKKQLSGGTP